MAPMTGVAQSVLDLVNERKVTESTLNEQPKDEHQFIGGMKQEEIGEIVSDGQSCATSHDHAYDHQIDHLPSAPLNESASLICSFAECVDLTFNHRPSLLRHTRLKHSQSLHPIHCKPFSNVRRPSQLNHVLKIVVTSKMACSLCDKWFQWRDDLEMHVIQEHTVRTVVTTGFGRWMRPVDSVENLERHPGVLQELEHQVIELSESTNQSFDCPHNQLLPENQQQTHQQPQRQQINLHQFNANSTQTTSSNLTYPLQCQPVSSSLDQFCTNFDQSSSISIQFDIKPDSTLENSNLTLKQSITLSKPITSKPNNRDKKFRTHKDIFMHYCSSLPKECKMMRNRKELLAHLRTYHDINLDQPNSLQSIPLTLNSETLSSQQQPKSEKEVALKFNEDTSLKSPTQFLQSFQHSFREYKLDKVEMIGRHVRTDEVVEEDENVMDIDQNKEQSEEHDRDVQTTGNYSDLSVVTYQMSSEMSEDDQYARNNEELTVNEPREMTNSVSIVTTSSSQPQQSQPLQSIEIIYVEEKSTLQVKGDQLVQNVPKCQVEVSGKPPSDKHVCNHCGRGFKRRYDMIRHTQIHTGERPYKCPKCFWTFKQNFHMRNHFKSQHDKIGKHLCPHCDRSFRSPSRFENHIRMHTFDQLNVLENRKNIDGAKAQRVQLALNVASCQVVVPDKSQTAKHICEDCGKGFKGPYHLKVHIRTHTGEKPYKCLFEGCNRTFSQLGGIQTHRMIHTGERPHVCKQCKKGFRISVDLTRHIRTHTGERPYECLHCGKAFTQNIALKKHILIHIGERPYVCEQCHKAFRSKSNLTRHWNTHTGKKLLK